MTDRTPERHPDDLLSLRDADDPVYVPPQGGAGDIVVRADLVGTALFALTAALAAAIFTSVWQWIAAVTVLVLFAAGIFAFLWAYYNAVQRSRTEEITVSQLYFLFGPAIPSRIRRTMLGALAVQVVVALVTAFARLDGPDGNPGSSLALGFLVPMFGFGMNGLWAAYHADFPPRATTSTRERRAEPAADEDERAHERQDAEPVAPASDMEAEPDAGARQASESPSELGGERSEPEDHVELEDHDERSVPERPHVAE